jgi:hypothetical protein
MSRSVKTIGVSFGAGLLGVLLSFPPFSLDLKEHFDQGFQFQDTDPSNPEIIPEQSILARLLYLSKSWFIGSSI